MFSFFKRRKPNIEHTKLNSRIDIVLGFEEIIMAAIDDLNSNLAMLSADVADVKAKIDSLNRLATIGVPEVDVQAAAAKAAEVHAALVEAIK